MDISKIKLFIWDLDETFWKGVLSDGTVSFIDENIQLVKNMIDSGVICSICSKNDEDITKKFLKDNNLFDLFVFISINWSPKGERVKQIINEMQLREQNVAFIDDNKTNLAEVKSSCPDIITIHNSCISDLSEYFKKNKKKDVEHNRLNQYKILEKKSIFKAVIGSNEEFLKKCHIKVEIKYDCINHVDRIEDLILRSNQLNFTKNRSEKNELIELFNNKNIKTGYVHVNDDFGDYGIVGFYAIQDSELIHFTFSCRVLNMGIEQYVYNMINRPKLNIIGDVSSDIYSELPDWINNNLDINDPCKYINTEINSNIKLLIKGPCDMSQTFSFIKDNENIIKEFTYIGKNGVSIEGHNHTVHIIESLTLDEKIKKDLIENLPFGDELMFTTKIFDSDIKFIYYSMFTDPNLGLYKHNASNAIVAFGEFTNDLTDEKMWNKFIKKEVFVANCQFTEENLHYIKDNFTFIGRLSPEQVVNNIDFIFNNINKDAILILNLGSTTPYLNNKQNAYDKRECYNKDLNKKLYEWGCKKERVRFIDVNKYINDQKYFVNNINHFTKNIYYAMSHDLLDIINECDHHKYDFKGKNYCEEIYDRVINKLKRIINKHISIIHRS